MKKLRMLFLAALLLTGCSTAPAPKTDAELEAEGWVKNPEANGYIKMEDALTTASVAIDESQQLSQPEIRELALDYLRGWPLKKDEAGQTIYSYREMYQIATSYNNEPGLSSVEFVLDPQTMKLYASSEKGTEKCVHIAKNPKVVL